METESVVTSPNKTILWINSGGKKKRFTLEVAKRAGLRVILVNKEVDVPPRLYHRFLQVDTYDHSAVIDAVESYLASEPDIQLDGALTFWEDDIPLLARVCEHFSLPGNPPETAIRTRNKYEMRTCFERTGLSSPKFHLLRSEQDVRDAIGSIGFPAVMKPAWGADSEFVVLVKSEAEALNAWEYLRRNCNESFNPIFKFNSEMFLYEQYVDGVEVSVECFSQYGIPHVLGVNEKQPIQPPYFVEYGDICPARLDDNALADVKKLAESALIALGVCSSLSHVEMKVSQKGPVLIEVASRMGGDDVYQNIKTVYGHDLVRIALQIAVGEHVKVEKRGPKGCVVSRYFIPSESGIITNISDTKPVRKSPHLVELILSKRVGEAILTPPEGFENAGWIVTRGNSYQEAESALDKAMKSVEVNVTPFRKKSALGSSLLGDSLFSAATVRREILRVARMRKIREQTEQSALKVGLVIDSSVLGRGTLPGLKEEVSRTEDALRQKGHVVVRVDVAGGPLIVKQVQALSPDFCLLMLPPQGLGSCPSPIAAGLLEFLGIPFLGAGATALHHSKDLVLNRKLFEYHEIPTPDWDYVTKIGEYVNAELEFPLVIRSLHPKAVASGIEPKLIRSKAELSGDVDSWIAKNVGPILIEEFVEGELFEVFLFGNRADLTVLPPYRKCMLNEQTVATSFDAFGDNGSNGSGGGKKSGRFLVSQEGSLQILAELSIDVYRLFECRDYGRVDILVDKFGNPYVMNFVADPQIGPESDFFLCAKQDGYTYEEFLDELVTAGLNRIRERESESVQGKPSQFPEQPSVLE